MSRKGKYDSLDTMFLRGTPMHDEGEQHWKSKDGRVLHYTEMDDQHVRNVIALVRRRKLAADLLRQIDNLNVHQIDQEVVKLGVLPVYSFLLVEQDKRQLVVSPPDFYDVHAAISDVRHTQLIIDRKGYGR